MQDDFPTPRNFVLVAVIFEAGLGVLAVVLGWLLGHPPADAIHWNLPDAAWGTIAVLPPMLLLLLCVKSPIRPLVDLVRAVDELLVPLFKDCRLWELAVISAVAGLGEEMLFRGVIQEAVAGWVGGSLGMWVGLLAASVLFGLAHPITPAYAVLAAMIGVYLGWLWLAFDKNLLVPITAHALYDFLALIYLVRTRGRRPDPTPSHPLEP